MAKADGVSMIQETMYDNRFSYANELIRMGASVKVDGRTAIVEGVDILYGAPVTANDLRGGAALLIASLSAQGDTEIYGIKHIDRGYEGLESKLTALGAKVQRVAE
jgi:UDP-N-acetylglucosamine 1-carboxyvinyltransferase